MDPAAIAGALRDFFAGDSPAAQRMAAAYLFGSVARGNVDVAVLTIAGLAGLDLDLEEELERLLGVPVQVLVLDDAPVELVHYILRDSSLLLNRDPSRRVTFEVKARREYFDLLPILRRYRGLPAEERD